MRATACDPALGRGPQPASPRRAPWTRQPPSRESPRPGDPHAQRLRSPRGPEGAVRRKPVADAARHHAAAKAGRPLRPPHRPAGPQPLPWSKSQCRGAPLRRAAPPSGRRAGLCGACASCSLAQNCARSRVRAAARRNGDSPPGALPPSGRARPQTWSAACAECGRPAHGAGRLASLACPVRLAHPRAGRAALLESQSSAASSRQAHPSARFRSTSRDQCHALQLAIHRPPVRRRSGARLELTALPSPARMRTDLACRGCPTTELIRIACRALPRFSRTQAEQVRAQARASTRCGS